jgi:hypothetical protein
MDSKNEQSRQESRNPDRPHHDSPRPSRQSGRGQRQNQGRDQGNRASGGAPGSGPSDDGSGNRGKPRGGPSGQQQEGRDGREGRRRRKDGGDRRGIYGFGDAIERCTCLSHYHEMPDNWPVHSRSNLATLRMVEVDRRASAILFCDGTHGGPHLWPDGEIVGTSAPAPATEPLAPPSAENSDDGVESNL